MRTGFLPISKRVEGTFLFFPMYRVSLSFLLFSHSQVCARLLQTLESTFWTVAKTMPRNEIILFGGLDEWAVNLLLLLNLRQK